MYKSRNFCSPSHRFEASIQNNNTPLGLPKQIGRLTLTFWNLFSITIIGHRNPRHGIKYALSMCSPTQTAIAWIFHDRDSYWHVDGIWCKTVVGNECGCARQKYMRLQDIYANSDKIMGGILNSLPESLSVRVKTKETASRRAGLLGPAETQPSGWQK